MIINLLIGGSEPPSIRHKSAQVKKKDRDEGGIEAHTENIHVTEEGGGGGGGGVENKD